jgi:photosystem II stability/assembly factor-like uncharacterized protein
VAVDPQNADIVWVGGGETDIRGNTAGGDGLWKTTDGGKTWTMLGFREEHIATIRIHPTNKDVAWFAVFGNPFKAGDTRGVYKTTDGGKTFSKVLFVNDSTGAIDLHLDPSNPDVMYAATWQAYRTSWAMSSGGTGSAIWKSTDGGTTWTSLTKTAKGLPTGTVGKIGLTISPAKPSRLWAVIEHDSGGVYRSDDAGATWSYINRDRKLRQRAWYYSNLVADPKDTNVVYALNVGFYRSKDGGKTFREGINVPHGDNHDLWIAPNDPLRMVEGNDGGATVSTNGGKNWTDQEFATAQMYHVDVTNDYPYQICGAQQDNSTLCAPSRGEGRVNIADWKDAGGGESGYVTPHPTKPGIVFAGSYGGLLTRKDMRTGFTRDITVYPINPMGYSSKDIKVRFQWTFPIVFSRHNDKVLYAAGSRLFRSTDEGESWAPVSPELARRDPKTMDASGGPITKDQTGVETYALIFAFDESPVRQGVLWVGTDDGLVWVSKNNGVSWENVTPKDIGDFTRISIIEPGHYDAGTAYVAANRYQLGDKSPILYKTDDYGKTWTKIVNGIAPDHFLRVVREDPVRRGLLFAGTERGVYVSFDDGRNWASLKRNLPLVPVHDLRIKDADVIAATHGRSFWVMDNIAALRQLKAETPKQAAHLFQPSDAIRSDFGGGFFAQLMALFGGGGGVGSNPPGGAHMQYYLKDANQKVTLEFLDAAGKSIAGFTSEQDPETSADSLRVEGMKAAAIDSMVTKAGFSRDSATKVVTARFADPSVLMQNIDIEEFFSRAPRPPRVPNKAGMNTFSWDMRYPDAVRFDGMIMWAAAPPPRGPAGGLQRAPDGRERDAVAHVPAQARPAQRRDRCRPAGAVQAPHGDPRQDHRGQQRRAPRAQHALAGGRPLEQDHRRDGAGVQAAVGRDDDRHVGRRAGGLSGQEPELAGPAQLPHQAQQPDCLTGRHRGDGGVSPHEAGDRGLRVPERGARQAADGDQQGDELPAAAVERDPQGGGIAGAQAEHGAGEAEAEYGLVGGGRREDGKTGRRGSSTAKRDTEAHRGFTEIHGGRRRYRDLPP